jgi:hypothetical protein
VWAGWLAIFAGACALYGLTASRAIGWQDSGQFVVRVMRGELADPYGLALTHPLHFWICRLCVLALPVDPARLLPIISAIFGALAVANVFGIVKFLTRVNLAAIIAAVSLAFAHTFWHMSTLAKGIDPLAAALWTAEFWALVRWDQSRKAKWLIIVFFFNGLGLACLNMALLSLPVIGIILIIALRNGQGCWRTVFLSAIAWLIGSSLFTGYVAAVAWNSGDIAGTIHSALFGNYANAVAGRGFPIRYTLTSIAFTILSFPNLILPAAALGVMRGRSIGVPKLSRIALVWMLGIHLLFVLRYGVIDQYTFLLPAYAMIAIFAGIGLAVVKERWQVGRRNAVLAVAIPAMLLTPVLYFFVPALARHFDVLGAQARHRPYRDDYRYLFVPWGLGEDSARRMSHQAVELAGRDGVIISEDPMGTFAIRYQLERMHRPGVKIVATADAGLVTRAAAGGRPVVLVPATTENSPAPPPRGTWQRRGDLYLLRE